MKVADKHLFAKAFADQTPIEVPAPELGADVVVRFKPAFTVEDVCAVVCLERDDVVEGSAEPKKPAWQNPLLLELALARIALLDEDGRPMVEANEPEWFQIGSDGVLLCRLARRAGLVDRFLAAFRSKPDGDNEPLTADGMRRIVADLATVMKISPESIRSWPAKDLTAVLESMKEQADARAGD